MTLAPDAEKDSLRPMPLRTWGPFACTLFTLFSLGTEILTPNGWLDVLSLGLHG